MSSVLMTFELSGDPSKLEEFAQQNGEKMRTISDRAKEHGAVWHRFYGSDDGRIMVVDQWPDAESFQRFFEASPDIGELMQGAGAEPQGEPRFWRRLDTHDEIGD